MIKKSSYNRRIFCLLNFFNIRMMIKPIEDSIYILNNINYKIEHSLETVTNSSVNYDIDEKSAEAMFYYIVDLGIILSVSYADELNKFFYKAIKIEKGEAYSKEVMKIIKIYKGIIEKRFPDLKDFRNNYLAHNMRIEKQNNKNVVLDGDLRRYRVPQNMHDYVFLATCIKNINLLIQYFFPGYLANAKAYQVNSSHKLPLLPPQFLTFESIQLELKITSELVDKQVQVFEQTFVQPA